MGELFESVHLYSGDGLEMAGHLAMILGERFSMIAAEVSCNWALLSY